MDRAHVEPPNGSHVALALTLTKYDSWSHRAPGLLLLPGSRRWGRAEGAMLLSTPLPSHPLPDGKVEAARPHLHREPSEAQTCSRGPWSWRDGAQSLQQCALLSQPPSRPPCLPAFSCFDSLET